MLNKPGAKRRRKMEPKLISWNEYEGNSDFNTREQWENYLDAVERRVGERFPDAEIVVHRHPNTSGGGPGVRVLGYNRRDEFEIPYILHELVGEVWCEHQEMMK
jgi:hypothetical protein